MGWQGDCGDVGVSVVGCRVVMEGYVGVCHCLVGGWSFTLEWGTSFTSWKSYLVCLYAIINKLLAPGKFLIPPVLKFWVTKNFETFSVFGRVITCPCGSVGVARGMWVCGCACGKVQGGRGRICGTVSLSSGWLGLHLWMGNKSISGKSLLSCLHHMAQPLPFQKLLIFNVKFVGFSCKFIE